MAALTGVSWDELRKQARQLENEIDVKLVAFSKLGANPGSNFNPESVPLISSEDMFDTLSMELQQLLSKLSQLNDKLADVAPSGIATMHTIKRHREILMDYQQELSKTTARVNARREREELLRGGSSSPTAGLSRRDQYAKEASHLHSSHMLVDEQINIAMEAREHLNSQRHAFKRMQTTFNNITNSCELNGLGVCSEDDNGIFGYCRSDAVQFTQREGEPDCVKFPMVNSLIYRINARKRRDSLILGIVVAVCTFLMLLYAFH